MLQTIRDRATGWIAWVIVIFISIPFALWGVQEYAGVGGPMVAASVNGAEIPLRSLQQEMQKERSRLQRVLGDAASQFVSDDALRERVLQRMIDVELRQQGAYSAGFRVGDARVAREIDSIDAFKREGRFDQQLYERVLMRNSFTPQGFEDQVRGELLTNQLVEGIVNSAFATSAEVEAYLRVRDQRRSFRHVLIRADANDGALEVGEEDIAKEYEANRALFVEPEKIKVEYLDLDLEQVMASVALDDVAVEAFYQENKERYRREEQRRASHILLAVEEGADQQRVDQVRAEAMSLYERIREGEDFATLAKGRSEDPGSAAQGGDLGFFGKGVMVGPFEDAVFSMQVGEVSEPVRSPFGFHIIRLDEVKAGETKAFADVKGEVEREFRRREAEGRFVEQAEVLTTVAFENPTSLAAAAQALGLEVQASDWFSREAGGGVATDAKVREAAFETDVLEGGNNSAPIELGNDRVVVVRRLDRQPAAVKPLEVVREQIAAQLRERVAREAARAAGEAMVQALRSGEGLGVLADARGVAIQEVNDLLRSDAGKVDPKLMETVFRMARPVGDAKAYEGVAVAGGYAVVELTGVEDGDPAKLAEVERRSEQTALARGVGGVEFEDLMSGMRTRADIEISKVRVDESR